MEWVGCCGAREVSGVHLSHQHLIYTEIHHPGAVQGEEKQPTLSNSGEEPLRTCPLFVSAANSTMVC